MTKKTRKIPDGKKSTPVIPTFTKADLPKQIGKKSTKGRKWFDGQPEEIVLSKLEAAFKTGTTNRRACLYADISESTFYRYLDLHPEFKERIALWEENILLLAEAKLFESVQQGNMGDVHYVLERRDKARYSPQMNIITDNGTGALTKERQEEIMKAAGNWLKKKNADNASTNK